MNDLELLNDLHKRNHRQGPGGDAETKLALELAGIQKNQPLKIADIGCGTGASTLVLARELDAEITAVDLLGDFLDILNKKAADASLSQKITTLERAMEDLPFKDQEFDVLWSEGAIYNIGFEKGIRSWRHYLKPGGFLVASELTWTTENRPDEISAHWEREYPEIGLSSEKISKLESAGYSPVAYFTLPEYCWTENYYLPLLNGIDDFLERNKHSEEAKEIAEAEKKEFELYMKYKNFFNYGVYIAKKVI